MHVKTQDIKLTYLHFQLITVSFYPYLFISICGKALLIFMLSLTCLVIPINNIITQTIFVVLFTSGSLLTWGKPLDALSGISPRYLSATYSQLTISPFFCRHCTMMDYAFFSLGSDRWGKDLAPLWGCLTICPPLQQFHLPSITQLELSSLMSLKAWGRNRRSITILPTCWYWLRRRSQGIGNMVFQPFGEPLSGQGPLYGGSS